MKYYIRLFPSYTWFNRMLLGTSHETISDAEKLRNWLSAQNVSDEEMGNLPEETLLVKSKARFFCVPANMEHRQPQRAVLYFDLREFDKKAYPFLHRENENESEKATLWRAVVFD